jgi:hypothetical protein
VTRLIGRYGLKAWRYPRRPGLMRPGPAGLSLVVERQCLESLSRWGLLTRR